jgi:RNA polymerase sigma-70 factor (ECF subfamily)
MGRTTAVANQERTGLADDDAARRFTEIAAPHLDAAYNLARWLARNPLDAEDIVQEAYLRAFRFFDGYKGPDARAWLLTIVRNTFYTWRKRDQPFAQSVEYDDAQAGHQGMDNEVETAATALHETNPETLLLRAADQRLVEEALLRLPAEYREILVLRELEDMSYRQIGEIAGLPLGTVMSRLSRARGHLRRELLSTGDYAAQPQHQRNAGQ